MEQLLLFQESKGDKLEREVKRLQEQCEKLRKSQFAKIGETMKLCTELRNDMEILKFAICKNQFTMK